MEQTEYERRPRKRKSLRGWLRATTSYAAIILSGAIFARAVMMTIDQIAARNGHPPGGEIFLPIYAAILPALGWYLRGIWDRATARPTNRKENNK